MTGTIQERLIDFARSARAMRAAALIACALVTCSHCSTSAVAQSSKLHAAFEIVNTSNSESSEPRPGTVRLASAEQKPAADSAKPPTPPPPARSSPPVKKTTTTPTAESQSPEIMEELPAPLKAVLPLAGAAPVEGLKLTQDEQDKEKGLITLIVRDKPLSQVLSLLAQTQHLNIVAANDIDVMISITLKQVAVEEALTAVLSVANYTWVRRNNIILITSATDPTMSPDVQGRQIQVFDLDFAKAAIVKESIENFMSPIGKVSVSVSSRADSRLAQERVVVEDLPESLARIATYIAQVDCPPRQVLIEAHVLQVTLDDTIRCGVNLSQLLDISKAHNLGQNGTGGIDVPAKTLTLSTKGFANAGATQAFLATLNGTDLGGVIEALQSTTDAKSLGSPKLLVLNEQEARLQVGETIYFKQITTTQTSSQQGAGSVEAGVILRVTPRITRDHRVLLHVEPEVSTPDGTGSDGLPPNISKTTLQTDVMLNDGQGMIIGGLIKDKDSVSQSKLPWLGNVRGVGWLFRRTETIKERVEIIVALVPRVQPYDAKYQAYEQGEIVKASVPLLHGPLCRTDRPWDPVLPDGKRVKYPLIPPKHAPPKRGYFHDEMPGYVVPPYPMPEQHFYGDSQECDPNGPQPAYPSTADPFTPDQELPLPDTGGDYSGNTHIISDQPIALKRSSERTSGVKK